MGMTGTRSIGRILYGLAFTVALPVTLVLWARSLDRQFDLPAYQSITGGAILTALGVLIWITGVVQIIRRGHGLPMNAFPPARFVSSGIYHVIAHPIYFGWVVACAGVSWTTGSASGLWIVTPVVALACAALVYGFERPDLRRRFGSEAASFRPWLSLPPDDERPPTFAERFSFMFVVLAPWLLAYTAVKELGVPPDAFDIRLDAEKNWPVLLWTVPIYVSAYLMVPLAAFLVPTRAALRRLGEQAVAATVVLSIIYLTVPVIAPFRPFDPAGPLGWLLALDQKYANPPVAAWPAFHVVWAAFVAGALSRRSRGWALVGWIWAAAVAVSCVTTGMHAVADIPAAMAFVLLLWHPVRAWRATLDAAERLANSWHAWRLGPIRIINHGIYPGLAALVGVGGMVALAGPDAWPGVMMLATFALVGAALWAQWADAATTVQRPFGYYGAVVGGCLGTIASGAFGQPTAIILAAAATMSPWIQALGRLRCLVQGCCHGAPVDSRFGIRVANEHSRVVSLSHLSGQSIHPTQVYSIAGNIAIGVLLLRLWNLQAPIWFISGAYLVLAGLARFVEEGHRGEPQTRQWLGMPIYQALSVASVFAGMALTSLGGPSAPPPSTLADVRLLSTALAAGVVYWFAMGVDFPESTRRFARLSG